MTTSEEELIEGEHSNEDDDVDDLESEDNVTSIEVEKLNKIISSLQETEQELGLEYVGRDKGQNREQRRAHVRTLKRVTRRPVACLQLHHPILGTLTPNGAKRLKRRRAKNRTARASRKVNRNG